MGDAIKAKKICDYEIYVPDIKLDNKIFIDDIKKEINIEKLDNNIVKKCIEKQELKFDLKNSHSA